MPEQTLKCPKCGAAIPLSESLAAPLLEKERERFEAQRAEDRRTIAAEEAKRAHAAAAADLDQKSRDVAELKQLVVQKDAKLAESQQAQAAFLRQQRALEDEKRELDLTVETRLQQSAADLRLKAQRQADDAYKLKIAEKDETIAGLRRDAEALRQRAEQGSQQLQGEVLEQGLEAELAAAFPDDAFAPVPKGDHGGDLLQRVRGPLGKICGTLLWEAKRTKNWSPAWLAKLREDQRAAGAEVAIIVSYALPKEVESFAVIEGVWVAAPRFAIPLAEVLRSMLISIAAARLAQEGQQTKVALAYEYLTSPGFQHRIAAMVENLKSMQDDLERERRATTRLWAKREQQIRATAAAAAGLYGDLQGIIGKSLQEIAGLELALPEPETAALPAAEGA